MQRFSCSPTSWTNHITFEFNLISRCIHASLKEGLSLFSNMMVCWFVCLSIAQIWVTLIAIASEMRWMPHGSWELLFLLISTVLGKIDSLHKNDKRFNIRKYFSWKKKDSILIWWPHKLNLDSLYRFYKTANLPKNVNEQSKFNLWDSKIEVESFVFPWKNIL